MSIAGGDVKSAAVGNDEGARDCSALTNSKLVEMTLPLKVRVPADR